MKKTFLIIILVSFCIVPMVLAQDQPVNHQAISDDVKPSAKEPDLADIIPLSAELTNRLKTLEKKLGRLVDIAAVREQYISIENNLKTPADKLERLKESKDFRSGRLLDLRETINQDAKEFERTEVPLKESIRQLGTWKGKWLEERILWDEWESFLVGKGEFNQFSSTFKKVNTTIDAALALIGPKLETMLSVQEEAGKIRGQIDFLDSEVDGLIDAKKRDALIEASLPMFSYQFLSEFRGGIGHEVIEGLHGVPWPDGRLVYRLGWIVLILVLFAVFLVIIIYRNRSPLRESKNWYFLAERPFAAALFFFSLMANLIYEYWGGSVVGSLVNDVIIVVSFALLIGELIKVSWKKHFVYTAITIFLATSAMTVINFPIPLFRLYIAITALIVVLLCLKWARENVSSGGSGIFTWALRFGALVFAFIGVSELWGKHEISLYLLASLIDSIVTGLIFVLFVKMIHGVLAWVFNVSPLVRATTLKRKIDTAFIVRGGARLIDAIVYGLILPSTILVIWGAYEAMEGAMKGILALGVNLGTYKLTLGLLVLASLIIYVSFLISWIVQKLIIDAVILQRQREKGARHSIARLIHYVIISVGFIFAFSIFGFDVTKITIIISALGVGLGFGLQHIVNNFVSGLVLLFERPVRVGDSIEIGGKWAEIKNIGLRATTVQTIDQADVMIPNADLVNNQVTNWTLSDRQVRLSVPVGVVYGSDVALVMKKLMDCAKANPSISEQPAPQVLFQEFGNSSLNFDLRVWVLDADDRLRVKSELHQEIDRSFREVNIVIAFPQLDMHLRSVDDSISFGSSEKNK
ncbi:mechanosensitive ion channel domain-containing protein [Candidatus Omnitrophota bacterium]